MIDSQTDILLSSVLEKHVTLLDMGKICLMLLIKMKAYCFLTNPVKRTNVMTIMARTVFLPQLIMQRKLELLPLSSP